MNFYHRLKGLRSGKKLFMTFTPSTFKEHYFLHESIGLAVQRYTGWVVRETNSKWERFQYLFGFLR